jgi:hypothetical protein
LAGLPLAWGFAHLEKFTNGGRTVVIHLVRGLPPKLSRDKKTITINFAERVAVRNKFHKE